MHHDTELPEAIRRLTDAVRGKQPERTADMFERCLANTWKTTLKQKDDGTTFVITGDIPAMWLRDSAAQVRPFLVLAEDPEVRDMIQGVVRRQFDYILRDPYANAFNDSPSGAGHQKDVTDMSPWVWERKYEIDSLCYPIQLSYLLWKNAGSSDHLDENFRTGVHQIIALWKREQRHEFDSTYTFERFNCPESDTLVRNGKGSETGYTGMTWSGFRPSDDACMYGYLVPSNMFAVVVLRYVKEIAQEVFRDQELAEEAEKLAVQIDKGIREYGILVDEECGPIYAYEVDGLGAANLMDDANVPSLLSLPYLGYTTADDPVYMNTRKFILSERNPYYYQGKSASGIGSPHTPNQYIWHIALAMQGMTSQDDIEKQFLLNVLLATDGGTGLMHEGFDADNPEEFTRPWFSWANMMFCELVLMCSGITVQR